jgi:hypothetical protein
MLKCVLHVDGISMDNTMSLDLKFGSFLNLNILFNILHFHDSLDFDQFGKWSGYKINFTPSIGTHPQVGMFLMQLGASMVKWTSPYPCLGSSESDSKTIYEL